MLYPKLTLALLSTENKNAWPLDTTMAIAERLSKLYQIKKKAADFVSIGLEDLYDPKGEFPIPSLFTLETSAAIASIFNGKLKHQLAQIDEHWAIKGYSIGREYLLQKLAKAKPPIMPLPFNASQTLWGIQFRTPLFNAAGMFKDGKGYTCCANQGAGAFLAGTTTALQREGNRKHGTSRPCVPYHISGAASNWLGLPNLGHTTVAGRLKDIQRIQGCPVGASVAIDPDQEQQGALMGLVAGMKAYEEAGVDFIELNESCPNVPRNHGLIDRLKFIQENFLSKRKRNLPVIVKLSNDLSLNEIENLLASLIYFGFDGINIGNTSTKYEDVNERIHPEEKKLYNYFVGKFGGGISGRPLKASSLRSSIHAILALNGIPLDREFHVIRTGGIESFEDLFDSMSTGVKLNQWYTGYFDSFGENGHNVYHKMFEMTFIIPTILRQLYQMDILKLHSIEKDTSGVHIGPEIIHEKGDGVSLVENIPNTYGAFMVLNEEFFTAN